MGLITVNSSCRNRALTVNNYYFCDNKQIKSQNTGNYLYYFLLAKLFLFLPFYPYMIGYKGNLYFSMLKDLSIQFLVTVSILLSPSQWASFFFFFSDFVCVCVCDVDHFKSLYWICYNIASAVYVLVFWFRDLWNVSSPTRDWTSHLLHCKAKSLLDRQWSPREHLNSNRRT